MEENIKILEGYLDRNTQLFEDYGGNAIIQDKEIQALENIIKEYRELEEELERQREINTIINKQNLNDNYERALEKTMTKFLNENIENDYIPKSKLQEKKEELETKKKKYGFASLESNILLNEIRLLNELMEDK